MRCIYLRKKNWWFRFYPSPGGAQTRVSLGTHDEAEAIIKAREIKRKAATQAREVLQGCDAEIAAYIASLRRAGLARSTVDSREYILKKFVADVEATSPRRILRPTVEKWFDGRLQKQPHTAVAYLNIVRWWFEWMTEAGKLTLNIVGSVKAPKLRMRCRGRFLLPDEARKLLAACDSCPAPLKRGHKNRPKPIETFVDDGLKFAVYCGLHAGLRKNEVVEARPGWFDLDAGLLHVQATATFEPKDRDNRTIPLTDEFKTWLRDAYKLRSPFMLESGIEHGKARYRYDFRKAFDSLAMRCELADLTFHDLRRTFASLAVSRGVSIYKVAKWLGDDVRVVQDTYGHLVPQDAEINAAWT
jgi:integrase